MLSGGGGGSNKWERAHALEALKHAGRGGGVWLPGSDITSGARVSDGGKHLGVVVVAKVAVRVPAARVQTAACSGYLPIQVAAVDEKAVVGKPNYGWVRARRVVPRRVKAPRAKGIPMQVRLAAALAHVFVACIHLARLWC